MVLWCAIETALTSISGFWVSPFRAPCCQWFYSKIQICSAQPWLLGSLPQLFTTSNEARTLGPDSLLSAVRPRCLGLCLTLPAHTASVFLAQGAQAQNFLLPQPLGVHLCIPGGPLYASLLHRRSHTVLWRFFPVTLSFASGKEQGCTYSRSWALSTVFGVRVRW